MTKAMKSPRHKEILTHRGANRRNGDIDHDPPSDSCFDVEDHSKSKPHTNCASPSLSTSPTSVGSTFPISNTNSNSIPNKHRRRRQMRRSQNGCQFPLLFQLFLFLVAVITVFFCEWMFPTRSQTTNHQTTLTFQKESHTGTASCSEPLQPNQLSYTLVTQVSADRLWMMEYQCQQWRFHNDTVYYDQLPISIAVFTNDTQAQVQEQLLDMGCDLDVITVQTVNAQLYSLEDYPVNLLRNLALKEAKTTHAVLVDIDFWISQDLANALQIQSVAELLAEDPKATLVIPAFMLLRQCKEWKECPEDNIPQMPLDFPQLKYLILDKQVTRFDPTNRGGHGSTKYKEWFHQNRPDGNALLPIDCFLSNRYEPYLVFRLCHELPPFQEPFAGYGKNKMTWIMQLRRLGYTFWQLGKGAFVIHYPHLDSPSRIAWNNAPPSKQQQQPQLHHSNNKDKIQWQDYKRGQMDQLFVQFRQWLQTEIPDQNKVPFCEDKLNDDARLWYDRTAFNATALQTART